MGDTLNCDTGSFSLQLDGAESSRIQTVAHVQPCDLWIRAGRPGRCDHPIRKQYKDAKTSFRAKLRASQREQRDEFFSNLNMNCQNTCKLFRMIRKHDRITTEPTSTLSYRGVHSGDKLMDAWADYFRDLVTSTNSDDSPDSNFHQIIKEQYSKFLQDTSFDPEPITFSQEVSETINSLKPNKACRTRCNRSRKPDLWWRITDNASHSAV